MNQKITGFHQDEDLHWVADLACGHTQHVRHDPPWQSRCQRARVLFAQYSLADFEDVLF